MNLYEVLLNTNPDYELYEAPKRINHRINLILEKRKEWLDLLNTICDWDKSKPYYFNFYFPDLTIDNVEINNMNIPIESLTLFKGWIMNKIQYELFNDEYYSIDVILSSSSETYCSLPLDDAKYGNLFTIDPKFICYECIPFESSKQFMITLFKNVELVGISLPRLIPFIKDDGTLGSIPDEILLNNRTAFDYVEGPLDIFISELDSKINIMENIIEKYNYIKQNSIKIFKKYIEQNPDLDAEFIGEDIL